MRKLSVVMITKNESRNIDRCLKSLYDIADDIVVLDARSTDNTQQICLNYNVNFQKREWTDFSDARNYAASLAANDFILAIDADEVLSKELNHEINALKDLNENAVYRFNRMTNFCGKFIKHSGWFPDWKTRIYDRRIAKWEGLVHEKLIFDKSIKIEKIKGLCYHYSFESEEAFRVKSESYAALAAQSDFQHSKHSSLYSLYLKPAIKFLVGYVVKFGWLDGREGMTIAKMSAHSTRLRYQILQQLYASKNQQS